MKKDIFGGTNESETKTPDIQRNNIEGTTKSTKPLSEILKGLRNINVDSGKVVESYAEGVGLLIVLLDTSSSMLARFETSNRMDTANSVLKSQLIPNMTDWSYGIITFGGTPRWYVHPSTSKTVLMISAQASGGTSMKHALVMSWDYIHTHGKKARIILISDGEPTDSSKQNILELAEINKGIPIDAVGIGNQTILSGYDPVFLRELSRIAGGIFCEAHTVKQLSDSIFKLSPVERPLLGSGKI